MCSASGRRSPPAFRHTWRNDGETPSRSPVASRTARAIRSAPAPTIRHSSGGRPSAGVTRPAIDARAGTAAVASDTTSIADESPDASRSSRAVFTAIASPSAWADGSESATGTNAPTIDSFRVQSSRRSWRRRSAEIPSRPVPSLRSRLRRSRRARARVRAPGQPIQIPARPTSRARSRFASESFALRKSAVAFSIAVVGGSRVSDRVERRCLGHGHVPPRVVAADSLRSGPPARRRQT